MKKAICSVCGKPFFVMDDEKEQDCVSCRDRIVDIYYKNMDFKRWDKKTPLCLFRKGDLYFPEEVMEVLNREPEPEKLRWIICEHSHINLPSFGIYSFLGSWLEANKVPATWDIPDDYDIEDEIDTILYNKVFKKMWIPGPFRTEVLRDGRN